MKIFILLFVILSAGCTITAPTQQLHNKDMTEIVNSAIQNNHNRSMTSLPPPDNAIINALLAQITIPAAANKKKPLRFDLMAQQLSAHDFFTVLSHESHENIIVNPNIKNTITLELHQVSLDEVMAALQKNYGYCYQHTRYGYSVQLPALQTRLFRLNYLDVNRHSQSQMIISSGEINSTTSHTNAGRNNSTLLANKITTLNDNHFWTQLNATINGIVGIDSSHHSSQKTRSSGKPCVIVNPQTGIIMVRAYPRQLQQVSHYLDSVERTSQREVIISAKIIEVTLNSTFQSGIDWHLLNKTLQQHGNNALTLGLTPLNAIFTLSAHWHQNFALLIKLLMTQGRVNVLSSPRIATINNQTAVIKVGDDQFFVTGVKSMTDSSSGGQSQSQNIDFTPFFSGVALNVTPHIDNDRALTLHIHPLVSTVTEKDKNFTVSGQTESIPLATSAIRESDSIVHVQDGQVIIIGGLMASQMSRNDTATPWLTHLPIVSALFHNRNDSANKKEIIILLQPTIIHHHIWQQSLKAAANQFEKLSHPFHFDTKFAATNKALRLKLLKPIHPTIPSSTTLQQAKKTVALPQQKNMLTLTQIQKLLLNGQAHHALTLLKQSAPTTLIHHQDYFAIMAALELQQQQYRAATALYQQLSAIAPDNAIYQSGLAIALIHSGQSQLAQLPLSHALAALDLPPALYRYLNQQKQ